MADRIPSPGVVVLEEPMARDPVDQFIHDVNAFSRRHLTQGTAREWEALMLHGREILLAHPALLEAVEKIDADIMGAFWEQERARARALVADRQVIRPDGQRETVDVHEYMRLLRAGRIGSAAGAILELAAIERELAEERRFRGYPNPTPLSRRLAKDPHRG